ncbi:methyltransferase domain-domain-containing protein [Microdochium bolleyi]|uniref:Methyltransferase domain-domain-containing protein n=1 Tax=Microdochium bolleyi TaxID=196109 RepID=A0A136J8X0_9PEZI|nr:methyltransferase domain-domain-containing protein [Microdochium bolleyi]
MLTLPSAYADIGTYAQDLLAFIDTPLFRQITGDIHVNDALIYDAWEALPPGWTAWWSTIPDHRLVQQHLIDNIEERTAPDVERGHQDAGVQGCPESLARWLQAVQSLALPRLQREGPSMDLPAVLTDRMKTKKIAEVSIAVSYIQNVCEAAGITHIVDMGSGQGYLSVSLAFLFPHLRVLAIDGSESQLAASRSAATSLGISDYRIHHLQRFIDGSAALVDEMAAWSGGGRCMLVGLHACGNLSEHMLRYFTTVPFITQLGAVGCCYNHIVPRSADCPDGFPISTELRERDVRLSATALMTGCQAPNNWERTDLSQQESEYSKRRFYRALLEKILFDKGIELDKENRPVWGVRKGDMASFEKFTRRAMNCLSIDRDRITHDELADYEQRYRGYNGRIAILWTLSVICCKIVESVIVLDRYLFLVENGGQEVDAVPIFDYSVSPRNLMLVARKSG